MTKSSEIYQQILFYTDRADSSNDLDRLLPPLGWKLLKTDKLESFFEQWQQSVAPLNLLSVKTLESKSFGINDEKAQSLYPLWILQETDFPNVTYKNPNELPGFVDDLLPLHLNPETFQLAQAFWSTKSPLFVDSDFQNLAQQSGEELAKKILVSFHKSLQQALVPLLASLDQRDLRELSPTCHAIKASCKLIGAQALYNLCAWAEQKNRLQSPISTKFALQARQILIKSEKYFDILKDVPIEKILNSKSS